MDYNDFETDQVFRDRDLGDESDLTPRSFADADEIGGDGFPLPAIGPPQKPAPTPEELQHRLDSLGLEGRAYLEAADELLAKHGYVYSGTICTCDDMGEYGHAALCGYILKSADEPAGGFPAEPPPGSPEAVAAAAETIRGMSPRRCTCGLAKIYGEPYTGSHLYGCEAVDWISVEDVKRLRQGPSPEPERPAHTHSFAVDISCECGIMLSAYTNRLATDLAAERQRNSILRLEVALLKSHFAVEKAAKEEAQRQRDSATCLLEGAEDAIRSLTIQRDGVADALMIWISEFPIRARLPSDLLPSFDSLMEYSGAALKAAGRLA